MNRFISFILSLVILAVGLSACSREGNPVESSTEGATSSERLRESLQKATLQSTKTAQRKIELLCLTFRQTISP